MCNCTKSGSAAKPNFPKASVATSSLSYSSYVSPKRKKTRTSISNPKQIQLKQLELFETGETLADKCQTFAYVLGLENPVPEKVLLAAIEDQNYAQRLLMHRNKPYLYELLNNPPESLSGVNRNGQSFSSGALITKAGKALLNWGLSGFPTVSAETLRKREDACLACPNLVTSKSILQKISASYKTTDQIGQRTGNKSCALCGCVIRNKIRLETETCPEKLLTTPGLNRWGENFVSKK